MARSLVAAPTRRRLTEAGNLKVLAPYYVENAAELLDAPGEWYLDRATGVLTYLPRPGFTRTGSADTGTRGNAEGVY